MPAGRNASSGKERSGRGISRREITAKKKYWFGRNTGPEAFRIYLKIQASVEIMYGEKFPFWRNNEAETCRTQANLLDDNIISIDW